jgi:transcriptional regulator with XRE-family HTH domain
MALAIGETKQTYQKIEQSQMIPTLSQLQEIAHVFGKELVIEFRG